MSARKAGFWNILLSIAFGAAIVLMSIAVEDQELVTTAMLVMVGIWFVPFAWLASRGQGEEH
ncbi:MAG: hypothetical protein LPD71_01405 [Shewanella sp.]|nr:hypothetical protein [Shewanella sp.]MCF1429447.1 hypothetical protein [Shewanella sp.]MCF1437440.1 hypothetical protein [Shewanella sp.]MCF1456637.1 hypothetical protein [Shewanella sp.]